MKNDLTNAFLLAGVVLSIIPIIANLSDGDFGDAADGITIVIFAIWVYRLRRELGSRP